MAPAPGVDAAPAPIADDVAKASAPVAPSISAPVPQRELARRASAQALPALASLPAGSDVTVSAPATAVEKSAVTVTVCPACPGVTPRPSAISVSTPFGRNSAVTSRKLSSIRATSPP